MVYLIDHKVPKLLFAYIDVFVESNHGEIKFGFMYHDGLLAEDYVYYDQGFHDLNLVFLSELKKKKKGS